MVRMCIRQPLTMSHQARTPSLSPTPPPPLTPPPSKESITMWPSVVTARALLPDGRMKYLVGYWDPARKFNNPVDDPAHSSNPAYSSSSFDPWLYDSIDSWVTPDDPDPHAGSSWYSATPPYCEVSKRHLLSTAWLEEQFYLYVPPPPPTPPASPDGLGSSTNPITLE